MANILVADDDAHVRALATEILEAERHRVVVAVNGLQAFQLFEDQGPWDVIVTDLHMPVLDGLGLIRAMAHRPAAVPVPVILVSGDPTALGIQEAFAALAKPIQREELVTAVDAALLYRSCKAWLKP